MCLDTSVQNALRLKFKLTLTRSNAPSTNPQWIGCGVGEAGEVKIIFRSIKTQTKSSSMK
jgi:hypothetical protein